MYRVTTAGMHVGMCCIQIWTIPLTMKRRVIPSDHTPAAEGSYSIPLTSGALYESVPTPFVEAHNSCPGSVQGGKNCGECMPCAMMLY